MSGDSDSGGLQVCLYLIKKEMFSRMLILVPRLNSLFPIFSYKLTDVLSLGDLQESVSMRKN